MAETKTYTQIEIQRYLQHKMSQQEMHEFEKALMNDPFLADALDGFSGTNAELADAHLDEIERLISGNYQTAKVVPLLPQKTGWWKVAAIILIIISAGAVTWSVVNNRSSFTTKNEEIASSTPAVGRIEKDSIRPADQPMARLDIMPKKQRNTSPIIIQDISKSRGESKTTNEVANETENKNRFVDSIGSTGHIQ